MIDVQEVLKQDAADWLALRHYLHRACVESAKWEAVRPRTLWGKIKAIFRHDDTGMVTMAVVQREIAQASKVFDRLCRQGEGRRERLREAVVHGRRTCDWCLKPADKSLGAVAVCSECYTQYVESR